MTSREAQLCMLRIEIDGHFHGGEPKKPWVAEIGSPCPRYGLQRKFVDAMNDWANAKRAWSGNIYGRIATFALREGRLYEVARCRGNPSKRRFVREFILIEGGKRRELTPEEALAHADGGGDAVSFAVTEGDSEETWAADVLGLGTPQRLGFVVSDGRRRYRLREGHVYETVEAGRRELVGVREGGVHSLKQDEAWLWLRQR